MRFQRYITCRDRRLTVSLVKQFFNNHIINFNELVVNWLHCVLCMVPKINDQYVITDSSGLVVFISMHIRWDTESKSVITDLSGLQIKNQFVKSKNLIRHRFNE